ncbi:MAG TPA: HAD family hydrolase [Candidatus Saccharimonadia bacterium]|nr:HAD family hydrolase [Candidatus Saccharimonadia bacterium]
MVEAVCLDVGETLINEKRVWAMWADWLKVPKHTFSAALGAAIVRNDFLSVFKSFRSDFDLEDEFAARRRAGKLWKPEIADLYADAQPAVHQLGALGIRVCIAGNQESSMGSFLERAFPTADVIATSEAWGVSKPSPDFFAKVCYVLDLPPEKIVHVGDRPDNDVYPAQEVGMPTVQVMRGPWAYILDKPTGLALPHATIQSLGELPGVLADLG